MLSRIKNWVGNHERNLGGWKTRRKIVVIESDDWGSIRMPSPDAYRSLKNLGIPVDKSPYCRYDSLASEEDIQNLYGMLQNHRDFLGRPPVITANVVVSNPDFDRIRESGWSEYFSEPISETFRKYPSHSGCLKLWNDGKSNRLFYMQSHGREHVNIHRWLELLREDFAGFRKAFDLGCWGLSNDVYPGLSQSIQAPFDLEQGEELKDHEQAVEEALILFQELFGYKSESFIAGNYIWSCELNKTLSKCGVKYLQGMKYQKLPRLNGGDREMIRHYLGERNEYDQLYLIRNCSFEPAFEKKDVVGRCLRQIETAFFWKKPAIITSHRINYVGWMDPGNRKRTEMQFHELISTILKRWPDTEFMTSVELGRLIENDQNRK